MSKTLKLPYGESVNDKTTSKDEGLINFRPSPNFKHKKYLKSKFEEDMNHQSSMGDQDGKTETNNKGSTAVQPPLPPNSPPPDAPPSIVKQEVNDYEYEQMDKETVEETEDIKNSTKEEDCKKPIMCKDFVRNECIRGAACNFAHEIDLAQLEGVYKFCRDFENGRCYRPVCNFVHAKTTEKEHFYRTAVLHPCTMAHMQKKKKKKGATEVAPIFKVPPSSSPRRVSRVRAAPAVPEVTVGSEPPLAPPPVPCNAPLKRTWQALEDPPSQPRECEGKEPPANKCKRCDLTELRLQYNKAQVAQEMMSIRELDEKLELIEKKNKRLCDMLRILLKAKRALEHVDTNFLLRATRRRHQ